MKVYECRSHITKNDFMKVGKSSEAVIYFLIVTGLSLYTYVNGGGELNFFSLTVFTVLSVIIWSIISKRMIMINYKPEQVVLFSEEGIKEDGEAIYRHWSQLSNAKSKGNWIAVKYLSKVYWINRKELSEEAWRFLAKRLRGVKS